MHQQEKQTGRLGTVAIEFTTISPYKARGLQRIQLTPSGVKRLEKNGQKLVH